MAAAPRIGLLEVFFISGLTSLTLLDKSPILKFSILAKRLLIPAFFNLGAAACSVLVKSPDKFE